MDQVHPSNRGAGDPNEEGSSKSAPSSKDGLIRKLLQSSPLELSQLSGSGSQQSQYDSSENHLAQFISPVKQLPPRALLSPGRQQTVKYRLDEDRHVGPASRLVGTDRLIALIQLDHSYSKPWRPDASNTLPTKVLFSDRVGSSTTNFNITDDEDEINIELDPVKPVPPYDPQQARKAMSECERYSSFANPHLIDTEGQGWEEAVVKDGWTQQQKVLYTKMIKVLHLDRLSRLSQEGRDNEPVLRRITVDKSAKRARSVLSSHPVMWDTKTVQWLHSLFTEYLPKPYLAAWIDIIQTLKSKVPALIDRLLSLHLNPTSESKIHQIMAEGFSVLLNRPWDPAASSITRRRLDKLPGNPIIIVAPSGPGDPRKMSRRLRLWNNQLGCLGKVIVINVPMFKGEALLNHTVNHYLYQMVSATLGKVRECKNNSSDRPVVLMGWGAGAAIAVHIAGVEKLAGLVCLGFPTMSLSGNRGELGDSLLDIKTPTLFVVGEKSSLSNTDDIEDFRERLPVETGLVIVGSADNNLRMTKRKKRQACVTQSMVDQSIMDEIREFLAGILTSSCRNSSATFAVPSNDNILSVGSSTKKARGRKRNNSSQDGSGPLSPKKRRPGSSLSAPGSRPTTPGSAPGSGGSTPIKLNPGSPVKRRKKARKSLSAEIGTSFPAQVVGSNPFPPGLLSISSPLPQSTLGSDSTSPPPLTIRVPISLPTTISPVTSQHTHPALSQGGGPQLVGVRSSNPMLSPQIRAPVPLPPGVRVQNSIRMPSPVRGPNPVVSQWGPVRNHAPRGSTPAIRTSAVRGPTPVLSPAPRGPTPQRMLSTIPTNPRLLLPSYSSTSGISRTGSGTVTSSLASTPRVIQYAAKSTKALNQSSSEGSDPKAPSQLQKNVLGRPAGVPGSLVQQIVPVNQGVSPVQGGQGVPCRPSGQDKLFIISVPAGEAGKNTINNLSLPTTRPGGSSLQITPVNQSQSLSKPTSVISSSSTSPGQLPVSSQPAVGFTPVSNPQPEVKKPEAVTERQDVAQILASLSGFVGEKS